MASSAHLPEVLRSAKIGYVARRLAPLEVAGMTTISSPRPGDLVVAAVTSVGWHDSIELPSGRPAKLYPGDHIVVAYGPRYAPDQFEAEMPADLHECHLVARGGLAAIVRSRHTAVAPPTRLQPIGLLAGHNSDVINVAGLAAGPAPAPMHRPPTVGFVGTSMNSGKSTAMASFIRGLTKAGLRVGATKVTGTVSGNDPWKYLDAGAVDVLDFTDAGYASTYRVPIDDLADATQNLHDHLSGRGVDAIVVEIADGILQPETRAIIAHPAVRPLIGAMVCSAGEAAGAIYSVQWLHSIGHRVAACSGMITAAPLAVRELREVIDLPVLTRDELADADIAMNLLASVNSAADPKMKVAIDGDMAG